MNKIKHKIKAVIFDMDGTIIRTEHLWDEATRKVLARRGIKTFTEDQYDVLESFSGVGLDQSAKILKKEFGLKDSIKTLVEETKKTAHKLFDCKLEFIDGFETFHKKLRKLFIPTSLASNADRASMSFLSKKMKFHKFFGKNIYSVDDIGSIPKPKPDIFLHAAKQLDASPHECVVFEDSLFGFQAANAAGMKCIAIKNKINQKNISLAHLAIDSYDEAEEAILKLWSDAT